MTRFRYALQAVLLTREWEVDRLRSEMASHAGVLAQAEQAVAAARAELAEAGAQWLAASAAGQVLGIDRLVRLARYAADRRTHVVTRLEELEQVEHVRDELVRQLAAAQRAAEGMREHRARERDAYWRAKMSGECRAADEMWLAARAGKEQCEHQS